jgi:hypothetical protein
MCQLLRISFQDLDNDLVRNLRNDDKQVKQHKNPQNKSIFFFVASEKGEVNTIAFWNPLLKNLLDSLI